MTRRAAVRADDPAGLLREPRERLWIGRTPPVRDAKPDRGWRALAPAGRAFKGIAGIAIAIAAWQCARALGLADPAVVPSFWTIVEQLAAGIRDGALTDALAATLKAAATGLAIAIALGVPIGVLIGLVPFAERTTRLLFEFIRPIPSVAFIPVAIIVLGLGIETEILVVAFASFWLILFNTKAGIESVEPRLIESARMLHLSAAARTLRVALPASLPSIATGIRLAASTALVVAISAEILLGGSGLGFYLESARVGGNADVIWSGALAAGITGYLINAALLALERRALRWNEAYRDG